MARSRKAATVVPPREIPIGARISAASVPDGWDPASWATRLEQLAELCAAIATDTARDYRAWALAVRVRYSESPEPRELLAAVGRALERSKWR